MCDRRNTVGVQCEQHIIPGRQQFSIRNVDRIAPSSSRVRHRNSTLFIIGTMSSGGKPNQTKLVYISGTRNIDGGVIIRRIRSTSYRWPYSKAAIWIEQIWRTIDLRIHMVVTVRCRITKTTSSDEHLAIGQQNRNAMVGTWGGHTRNTSPAIGAGIVYLGRKPCAYIREYSASIQSTRHQDLPIGQYGTVMHCSRFR